MYSYDTIPNLHLIHQFSQILSVRNSHTSKNKHTYILVVLCYKRVPTNVVATLQIDEISEDIIN